MFAEALYDLDDSVDDTGFMVACIKGGDKYMESEFCNRYYPLVLGLIRFYAQDQSRAEDISQDVLIKVLLKLRATGIDRPESLTSYVRQTAKYTYLGWTRRMANRTYLHETGDTQFYPGANPEKPAIDEERRLAITRLIAQMAVPRDRDVLSRYYFHDETKPLICEVLALSSAHFDRIISRARSRLRQLLEQEEMDIWDSYPNVS